MGRVARGLAVMVVALLVPGVASGATVRHEAGIVAVEAGPGEQNILASMQFRDTYGADSIAFRDDGATLQAGTGCVKPPDGDPLAAYVICDGIPDGVPMEIRLGDGNDSMRTQAVTGPMSIWGGPGDDNLGGGGLADRLFGEEGSDRLSGDEFYAPSTTPTEWDQHGADDFSGGPGRDLVSYYNHKGSLGVTVTIDDKADDGDSGEGDNVRTDVEDLEGPTFASARFTGSDADNALYGTPGQDVLDGRGGDDTIQAADGFEDRIACGAGNDLVKGDSIDKVVESGEDRCETLDGPVRPGGGGGTTPTTTGFVSLPKGSLRVRGGEVTIAVACRLATRCRGLLRLRSVSRLRRPGSKRRARVTFGTREFSIAAGSTRVVRVKVSRANRRLIPKRGLSAVLEAATLSSGAPSSAKVKLRR